MKNKPERFPVPPDFDAPAPKEKAKCLFPPCENPAKARGLCASHYAGAFYHVQQKLMTWAELEAEGKALPSQRGGRRFSTWLLGAHSGKEST